MAVLKALINGEWVRVSGTGDPDTARWNSAWGIVAQVPAVPASTVVTLSQVGQAVTSALTWTAVAGRKYRIAFKSRAIDAASPTSVHFAFALASTPTVALWGDDYASIAMQYGGAYFEHIFTGDGVTRSIVTSSYHYGTTVALIWPTDFYIEDVGPVIVAASPPTRPPSVWQMAVYENGWTTLDSRPAMYRKVGDEVTLRGVIKGGTIAWGTAAFTLPPGYRPLSSSMSFPANAQGSAATVDVFSDGRVSIAPISTGVIVAGGWCYIDPVRFSVS